MGELITLKTFDREALVIERRQAEYCKAVLCNSVASVLAQINGVMEKGWVDKASIEVLLNETQVRSLQQFLVGGEKILLDWEHNGVPGFYKGQFLLLKRHFAALKKTLASFDSKKLAPEEVAWLQHLNRFIVPLDLEGAFYKHTALRQFYQQTK